MGPSEPAAAPEPAILLQLSDLHLGIEEGEPDRRLASAVAAAAELAARPHAVLLSGDIADEPAAEAYERAEHALAPLGLPIHAIPGNHDDRDLLAMRFAGRTGATGAAVNVLADIGGLRVIGCDTTVPGTPGGALGQAQLQWLSATLEQQPERPTLLALHHPPIASGVLAMDEISLDAADAGRLESLLLEHRQVLAVTCGHVHRTITTAFADRPLLVCPSTNSSLRLDLRALDGLPLSFEQRPVGFAVHVLAGGRLVSHVQPLADG